MRDKDINIFSDGTVLFGGKKYRCALGRGGVRQDKKEGDGVTPVGCFAVRKVFYRADKLLYSPRTVFPVRLIGSDDGWSDDVDLPEYNTLVRLPYAGSYESLWRNDDLYDILAVLGYNDNPPVAGKGSAIFMHVARPEYSPTAGCVAFAKKDLLEILEKSDPETRVCIQI